MPEPAASAPPGAETPALAAGDIHLWLCHHTRVGSSDALRRELLSRYTGTAPGDWRFERGEWGRPALVDPPRPLDFNLSDSGEWLAFGISAGAPIGVDLEQRKARRDVMRLARRFFHPEEIAALEAAARDEREALFYQLWTLKEAHVKCRGLALPPLLQEVGFTVENTALGTALIRRIAASGDQSHYRLLAPLPGYSLAVNWIDPAGPASVRLLWYRPHSTRPPL